MRRMLITETVFKGEKKQNFYWLLLQNVGDDGFYRAVMSFNAFFNSTRKPRSNVTKERQFTASSENEPSYVREHNKNVDWNNLQTFPTIWEFYEYIGYDYKKRKYQKKVLPLLS